MLKILDNKDFDKVFSIMEQSFPSDELRPYSEQKALLNDDKYKILIYETDGIIVAFIAVWEFEDILFIEHFAVDPAGRSGGIGTAILGELSALTSKTICLEVEPPYEDISIRRIGFYKRNGFYLNDYPYMQPPISKGKNPIPLKIMSYGKQLDKQQFDIIKNILYTYVYKIS